VHPRDERPLYAALVPPPPPAPAVAYFVIKAAEGWRRLVVMTLADISTANAKGEQGIQH
jgi:hypothetical protein